ncbi:flagellar hook-associated protein FlgL [Planococcus salinarum]|uniref:flagellar hook-associated protein FlgL n=1 Tax=Planococcus salinarum TaxID=622695 RepID=UPI000E3DDB3B|nr:flagellar hook-associated protein FlgL [Planococcus salinarum]TAA72223.1 flagellar hook-associated protein 3 [Planococcus salinarum]
MRISHQMLHQNSVSNMNNTMGRFQKAYNEALTGKQVSKPSDDPHGAAKAMELKSALATNEQYERNTGEAKLWLDETDQTVNSMVDVMQRVRELAVQGNNETLSAEDRGAVALEVEELTAQLRQFADTKVNGVDLFTKSETPPAVTSPKMMTVGGGLNIQVNATEDQLLGTDSELLTTLADLSAGLRNGEAMDLDAIDTGIDRLLKVSAEVGARTNRVESAENRMFDNTLQLKSRLSGITDIDMAEAITKLKSEDSVYQASLSASAKIIQPSLMDFLR